MPLIVNGEEVDQSVIDEEFSAIKAHYESLAQVSCCERDEEFMGYARENIVRRMLLAQESELEKLPVLKEEVDKALEKLQEEHGGEAAFRAHTGLTDETLPMLRQDLAMRIRLEKYIDSVCGQDPDPDEDALRAYYEKHIEDFQTTEEVRASHLFKSLRKSENKEELYNLMRDLRTKALAGEDFDDLAREHSDKEPEDVDLGWFSQGEHMDEFETIAFSLNEDEISPVFSTHWGFHLVKLTGRKPSQARDFQSIREVLRDLVIDEHRQSRIDERVKELQGKAEIFDKMENKSKMDCNTESSHTA